MESASNKQLLCDDRTMKKASSAFSFIDGPKLQVKGRAEGDLLSTYVPIKKQQPWEQNISDLSGMIPKNDVLGVVADAHKSRLFACRLKNNTVSILGYGPCLHYPPQFADSPILSQTDLLHLHTFNIHSI